MDCAAGPLSFPLAVLYVCLMLPLGSVGLCNQFWMPITKVKKNQYIVAELPGLLVC